MRIKIHDLFMIGGFHLSHGKNVFLTKNLQALTQTSLHLSILPLPRLIEKIKQNCVS